jgi:hypothetical protein
MAAHLMATGSERVVRRLHPAEWGMPKLWSWDCQLLTILDRNSGVNTPR